MRRCAAIVAALVAACALEEDLGIDATTEVLEPRAVVEEEVADEGPARASFAGDPEAGERQILDLSHAELDDDWLLDLPGSEGLVAQGSQAEIPTTAVSVGSPQRGRLDGGVQLPYDPALYTRRHPERSYGSSHTMRTIRAAMRAMRHDKHVHAEVIVGDISRPGGGWFPPHVSHQSGRDIDIRLSIRPGLARDANPTEADNVDWDAVWALVHSFLETGEVRLIFLGWSRQQALFEAGLRAGVDRRVLDRWFQWPDRYDAESMIRHEDGHLGHVHIRLQCGPEDPQCDRG